MLNRTISTSVSLPVNIYMTLRERAEYERRSMASVVREVIQRGLDHEQRDDEAQQQEIEQ